MRLEGLSVIDNDLYEEMLYGEVAYLDHDTGILYQGLPWNDSSSEVSTIYNDLIYFLNDE